MKNTTKTT